MHGAATSPNVSVFAHAGAQVKSAIDATVLLGGENYVLWGGREGYSTLLNTDYPQEQRTLAAFLRMVADYAKKAGLKGHLLLEPKPHEPSKHQCESSGAVFFLSLSWLGSSWLRPFGAGAQSAAGFFFSHDG